jgi:hypothetical protein
MIMCNKEQLVGYLYDDLPAEERAAFEGHVAACARCRQELFELRETRQHLATWAPPEPEFTFQVVQSARAEAAPPRPRFAMFPRWALAAAAGVLVAAGAAAIANIEVRHDANGFVVRTGWASDAPLDGPAGPGVVAERPISADARSAAVADPGPAGQLRAEVAALAQRVAEMEQADLQLARTGAPPRSGISPAELRKILAESESRQRTEMAMRFQQIWNDFNAARASDFVRVQQAVAPELQRQGRLLENVIYRNSGQR